MACIDDFSIKRRHTYGTVMINAQTVQIVDMLESRESDVVFNSKVKHNGGFRQVPLWLPH